MSFAVPNQNGSSQQGPNQQGQTQHGSAPGFPAFNGGLRDLFSTLDDLLTCGGDGRLMLDPISRLNEYGCGPAPSPRTLSFASSTASTISERGYERAGLAREELMRSAIAFGLEEALEARIEAMREETEKRVEATHRQYRHELVPVRGAVVARIEHRR